MSIWTFFLSKTSEIINLKHENHTKWIFKMAQQPRADHSFAIKCQLIEEV